MGKGGVNMWVMAFFDTRQRRDQAAAHLPTSMVDQIYREDLVPAEGADATSSASRADVLASAMPVAAPIPPTEPVAGAGAAESRADARFQLAVSTHRPDAVFGWLSQHQARWVELSDAPPR